MLLTMRDQQRIEAIQALMDSRLSAAQAAQVLGRSERQVWRLLARARDEELSGLLHGHRGREPANKSDDRLWQRVPKLADEKYRGVNDRHDIFHARREPTRAEQRFYAICLPGLGE